MLIPDWLSPHIASTCECGHLIIDNATLTQRYCSNPICPKHMEQRIVKLAKDLNVKNVGAAYARNAIRTYNIYSPAMCIPMWFKEKPQRYLWEIGVLANLTGIDREWQELACDCSTFDEVVAKPKGQFLLPHLSYLKHFASFFEVKRPLASKCVNVMLTGSIDGFSNRQEFLRLLNEKYGNIVRTVDVGKRKSNVAYLIKEAHTSDHSKTALAQRAGIPIVTPGEYAALIHKYCTGGGNNG